MIKLARFGHPPDVLALPAPVALPADDVSSPDRLTAMFEEHAAFVWRSLRRLGVSEPAVDDATQEVFLVANWRLAEIQLGKERAYLFGVAVRVASDARRRAQRRREDAGDALDAAPDPRPATDDLLDQRRARAVLDQLIAELPDDTRPVFILYELEGLTMAEIAAYLDLAPGTVASRLRRAREGFTQKVAALQRRQPAPLPPRKP